MYDGPVALSRRSLVGYGERFDAPCVIFIPCGVSSVPVCPCPSGSCTRETNRLRNVASIKTHAVKLQPGVQVSIVLL